MSTLKNLDVSKKSWDPILFYYKKKTRPAVSSCTGKFSGCTNENSNVRECANVYMSYMICHLGPHHLRACSRFQKMDPKTRRQAIIQVGACTNCLSTAHKVENCGSQATCRVCQQRHHSLLHHGATSNPVAGAATITGYDNPRGYALLRQGPTGQLQTCRAVTNAGSQVNLISRRMANLLSLKDMSSPIEIYGIGGKTTTAIRSILKLSSCPSGLKH